MCTEPIFRGSGQDGALGMNGGHCWLSMPTFSGKSQASYTGLQAGLWIVVPAHQQREPPACGLFLSAAHVKTLRPYQDSNLGHHQAPQQR